VAIGQVLRLRAENPCFLRPPQQLGFVGDVIVGRLCGRRGHDLSSLAIAMLCNPRLQRADSAVLERLELDEEQLPDLLPANAACGGLLESAASELGLKSGIPVSPAIHDQYAASLGAGAVEAGDVNFGCGTAWVLLANTCQLADPLSPQAFVSVHPIAGLYGQLISLGNGGSVLDWVLRLLGHSRSELLYVDALLDGSRPLSKGLICWPFLSSGNAPRRFRDGGRLRGLNLAHGPNDIIRAALEGLACELARQLQLIRAAGHAVNRLSMCGPGAL
jgi:xylulokinase